MLPDAIECDCSGGYNLIASLVQNGVFAALCDRGQMKPQPLFRRLRINIIRPIYSKRGHTLLETIYGNST